MDGDFFEHSQRRHTASTSQGTRAECAQWQRRLRGHGATELSVSFWVAGSSPKLSRKRNGTQVVRVNTRDADYTPS